MKAGADQVLPLRQLMTPLPCSPPKMNAALVMSGMTATHAALFQRSDGMPFSASARNVVTTSAAFERRFRSELSTDATAVEATIGTIRKQTAIARVNRTCITTSRVETSKFCAGLNERRGDHRVRQDHDHDAENTSEVDQIIRGDHINSG